ncbi:hypothetical protein CAPTEDRAFT_220135 [Capitella teleta]|uniref:Uncharacterized protein n=1 Tax=Capitella teleta TaxID=283909 RepID=R7UTE6_CAPTE|nr:hypothetical protein CAPTEDRAFT_220135 [Capitella teleta]|eukprot:ELU06651.1 hypothetical protein CAPTEDRAFT_220135 [Capitella teleta]
MYNVLAVFLLSLFAAIALGKPSSGVQDCMAYNYCQGTRFKSEFMVDGRRINCDVVSDPKNRCCLPQSKHFVCYNIVVEGQFLNYQPSNIQQSTNITGLCRELIHSQGDTYTPGRHNSATVEEEGGNLVWRDGDWRMVQKGNEHIGTLSCGYVELK